MEHKQPLLNYATQKEDDELKIVEQDLQAIIGAGYPLSMWANYDKDLQLIQNMRTTGVAAPSPIRRTKSSEKEAARTLPRSRSGPTVLAWSDVSAHWKRWREMRYN